MSAKAWFHPSHTVITGGCDLGWGVMSFNRDTNTWFHICVTRAAYKVG